MDPQPPAQSEPSRPDREPTDDTPTPAATSVGRRSRTAAVIAAAVVLALGATGAAAVMFMAGSDAKLLERIPATADVAFSVSLDPAAGQKVNLMRMLTAFPDVGDEQELRRRSADLIDEALADSGLTHRDLDWVGSQVAGFVDLEGGPNEPRGAVLLAVDDEEGAKAAMDTFVRAAEDRGERIAVEDHDGVQVFVSGDEGSGAAALVDGVMVFASGESAIDDVIGTVEGDSLAASPTFTETIAELPQDHLAMAYVNVPGLIEAFGEYMAVTGVAGVEGGRARTVVRRRHRGSGRHPLGGARRLRHRRVRERRRLAAHRRAARGARQRPRERLDRPRLGRLPSGSLPRPASTCR